MGAGSITRFPLLNTVVFAQMEVFIMGAGSITGFPSVYAVLSTHVESQLWCAEVWSGDVGSAVSIAEAIVCRCR